ncbi:MAG TPA: hypothetical protein VLN47_06050 [Clostridiaceae bacterium]|nr:hypothetical protein [Clostridiaceae bacterium]
MFRTEFKTPVRLSVAIAILAAIASAGGLFLSSLYHDNALITAAWHGNDFVTLFLALPVMVGSLVYSARGSRRAQVIWMGTLWYMVYNYMFYLFGAAFNSFFLIYAALFTMSSYALVLALLKVDAHGLSGRAFDRIPVKLVSGFMLFFAILLGVMWIGLSLSYVFTGVIPVAIAQTDHPTGVVFAIDLTLIVPSLILCAVALYRRKAWGFVLSTIVMIKASTYALAMIAMSVFSYLEVGILDPLILLWAVLGAGCLASCYLLLRAMKPAAQDSTTSAAS